MPRSGSGCGIFRCRPSSPTSSGRSHCCTRIRLAFILVDETFGLTIRAFDAGVEDPVAYKTAADLMLYSGWILGTAVGAWFGSSIDPGAVGIGVLFGLLFLGLAAPMVKVRRDWVVAGASGGRHLDCDEDPARGVADFDGGLRGVPGRAGYR